jgi:hypothetical protein
MGYEETYQDFGALSMKARIGNVKTNQANAALRMSGTDYAEPVERLRIVVVNFR